MKQLMIFKMERKNLTFYILSIVFGVLGIIYTILNFYLWGIIRFIGHLGGTIAFTMFGIILLLRAFNGKEYNIRGSDFIWFVIILSFIFL